MKIQIQVSLDTENDKDIIAYFDGMNGIQRNQVIRQLLRDYASGELDRETIRSKLSRIYEMISDLSVKIDGKFTERNTTHLPTLSPISDNIVLTDDVFDSNDSFIISALKNIGI